MVEDGPEIEMEIDVTRSWKERFFTFPWHPFQLTRVEKRMVRTKVPMKSVYRYKGVLIMHPEVAQQLKEEAHKWPTRGI